MRSQDDLVSFLRYISTSGHKSIKKFSARAALLAKPPNFFRTLPLGSVVVYPDFIIFLTLNTNSPGYSLLFKEVFDKVNAFKTVTGWVTEPSSLVDFLFEKLPEAFERKSDVEKMFSNPNSFFVSLESVKSVVANFNFSQGHSITVKTATKSFVVCQDALVEQRENYFESMWKMLTGQWHSDIINFLKSKI
ncbi:hypothetical protein [Calothrix sp. NIES-3974]|uniref:hypothetical protein n=1 Tax=Calothrix sp. NIES-3974 TaxID=2005462 RepID=UPI000B60F0E0|nr:hypothetical protein [Calothrix sp. NIES-3974]BAZ04319.1 hypothetical protein NIES3974_09520 [Calothrix sp. NIES-3974]